MKVYWYKIKNFGDALNPYIIEKISGEKPKYLAKILTYLGIRKNYSAIGSIFHLIGRNTIVWGTGIISLDREVRKPKKILAVRGPLTRKILIQKGIECPEIYGDPALLIPKYYTPKTKKKYKLGIIPHFFDYDFVKENVSDPRIKIIDIEESTEEVIESIFSCEKTISSSLHGLIVSHAYNIPSVWVEFSDKVSGKGFKFRDYLNSVRLEEYDPENFRDQIPAYDDLFTLFENKDFNIDIDLEPLESVCPFGKIKK